MLIVNGKTANSQPNRPLVINKHQRLVSPVINGLVPYHININGLDRPPVPSGCVFNAPLWHPALSGSTFKSLDAYAHSCTVTGATWTPQGRYFGGNAIIVTPTVAVGTGIFTMSCWVKIPAAPVALFGLIGGPANYAGLLMKPTGFGVGKLGVSEGTLVAYAIPLNTPIRVTAVVQTTTSADIFVNGVFIGTSTEVNAYAMANRIFNLGAAVNVADVPFTGVMGEAQVNAGDQSAREMQTWQAPKWRYS